MNSVWCLLAKLLMIDTCFVMQLYLTHLEMTV
uniref:Uncharacterized protein n=1 Tax=Arundo donax TaxID=35708 RepID=A0A0A9HSW3_ARUDO